MKNSKLMIQTSNQQIFSMNQITFADSYGKKSQTNKNRDAILVNNMVPHHALAAAGYTARAQHPENAYFKPKINVNGYMYGSELSQKQNPLLIKGQNQVNQPVFFKTKPCSPQGLDIVNTLGTLPSP